MNKRTNLLLILFILIFTVNCKNSKNKSEQKHMIIPEPVKLEFNHGYFRLNEITEIACGIDLADKAELLKKELYDYTGYDISIVNSNSSKNSITLKLDPDLTELGEEGYKLEVGENTILFSAFKEKGIFYAIQSFIQLKPFFIIEGKSWHIPCLNITDNPRFHWRGLMIDCSRTFWSVDHLKKIIESMALYKMNILHLHLTDDQGWRLEISKYPELTKKGARFPEKWNEPEEHEGFYTQQEMKELIEFAAQRNINILPEIEMPGHALAALSCYPELSCTGGPFEIHPFFKGPGIHEDIFCAGNDETFRFLEDILVEVAELFPFEYIHIGGDEAPKKRWEECSKCQSIISKEGLKNEHELQSWFIKRIENIINKNGKKMIGWDEITEGGLSKSASVMYWRGWMKETPANVTKRNNKVVMSPTTHCYFDYNYKKISTLSAYEFEPVKEEIEGEKENLILGLQANFWSHIDRSTSDMEKQLFPRILSIAEVGWTPKDKKSTPFFLEKVRIHMRNLADSGYNCYPDSTILQGLNKGLLLRTK